MKKYIFICDKCKKDVTLEIYDKPKNWKSVSLMHSDNQWACREVLLCQNCAEGLGFKEKINIHKDDTRDKIFKLFQEINAEMREAQ